MRSSGNGYAATCPSLQIRGRTNIAKLVSSPARNLIQFQATSSQGGLKPFITESEKVNDRNFQ